MSTNQIFQQSEVMRKKMFPIWQMSDYGVFSDLIDKGEVEIVNERDYKIPFKKTFGGLHRHIDLQGGDAGRGSSPTGNYMTQSFYSTGLAFEFDSLQIAATQNAKTAVQNPFLQTVADGYRELKLLWDKNIHGIGTATLAQAAGHSAASGVSVYTLDTSFGAQLLRRGQKYNVYNTGMTSLLASNVGVTDIDFVGRTVTLDIVVPSAANTDKICLAGVSGASPAGPRGLGYWVSSATTGYTASIDRATERQIISKSVDGSGGFTPEAVMALYHRIEMDRGEVPALVGVCPPAQEAYVRSNVMAIQKVDLGSASASLMDRLPGKLKSRRTFNWGGVVHYVDLHHNATAVSYIVPSDFGKAQLHQPKFFETPGKTGPDARFIQVYGASGGPAFQVWFGLVQAEDMYCVNPGQTGVITSLPLGTMYA
jgi:hypothetical protein